MTREATVEVNRSTRRKLARKWGIDERLLDRPWNRAAPAPTGDVEVTIPDTAEGFEQALADPATMRKLFTQQGGFRDFVTAYAKAVLNKDQEIGTQVRDEVQRVLADFLRENRETGAAPINLNIDPSQILGGDGAQMTPFARMAKKQGLFNKGAMGAAIDKEFSNSAEYLRAIWHLTNRDAATHAKLGRVRNAFSSTVPSEGGFLIPETLRSELLRVSLETSIVRPRARVIPMESLTVPFPAIDSTSNVSSVYGGIVGYWTEEGAALTESSATFSRIVLNAKKLTAYTQVPNELISDSAISFQAFIDQIFPEALGFYEDYAFLRGTGVGEPLGALNASAMITVAAEAGQAVDTIVWENVIRMYARMLPQSLQRAVWITSSDTFPELATMALTVGTGGSAIWLTDGRDEPVLTLLGRPVTITEKAGKLGDLGDLNFVDFGFYLIGDRQVMSAMSSPHFRFQNDQTAYRIIERVDGMPWLQSAITPKNAGPTLSPFVQLAAR